MQNNTIWFSDLDNTKKLTSEQLKEIGKIFNQAIINGKVDSFSSPALSSDRAARIIFISASNDGKSVSIYVGRGTGITNALQDVFSKFWQEWAWHKGAEITKIDIATSVKALGNLRLRSKFSIINSLDGIAFSKESSVALIPELISANAIINDKGYINKDRLFNAIARDPIMTTNYAALERLKSSEIFTFKTQSILIKNQQVTLLYRGHPEEHTITLPELEHRIKIAAHYLARCTYPNGKFDYVYRADKNISYPEYNIIRHAGTLYSMFEYYQVFPDQQVLDAARRALRYLLDHMLPGDNGNSLCLAERGKVALGGNALAAVTLAKCIEATGDKTLLPTLLKLGEWMLGKLQNDGQFKPQREFYLKEMPFKREFISIYYPGEAILGFLRIYGHDNNPKWLDAAEKAALWLITVRDVGIKDSDLPHDHWLLYALSELYRHRPRPIFIEHSARICRCIFSIQHKKGEYPDWHGGFYNPPRSTPAATRAEGMLSAYFLIKDFGNDRKLLSQILESIKASTRFQFRTQYLPENVMYLPNPDYALGGFHASLTDHSIRIDFVQHNISSLLAFYKIIRDNPEIISNKNQVLT